MDKIYVVFWTQGGNTQAMAEAIGEGIREAGKEAEVVFVTGANLDELKAAPKLHWAVPQWERKSWRNPRWSLLYVMWKALLPAKRSHCSAPMAGETVSG